MADSDDDWFEKDIDEFVVKAQPSNVEIISIGKALTKENTQTTPVNLFVDNGKHSLQMNYSLQLKEILMAFMKFAQNMEDATTVLMRTAISHRPRSKDTTTIQAIMPPTFNRFHSRSSATSSISLHSISSLTSFKRIPVF